jgi:hypothetical protein
VTHLDVLLTQPTNRVEIRTSQRQCTAVCQASGSDVTSSRSLSLAWLRDSGMIQPLLDVLVRHIFIAVILKHPSCRLNDIITLL